MLLIRAAICVTAKCDSDSPCGFTDEDDGDTKEPTKPGPVTQEHIVAHLRAKTDRAIRLQNLKERRRRGALIIYSVTFSSSQRSKTLYVEQKTHKRYFPFIFT